MTDMVIGIHLGTTSSSIAIPKSAEVHSKDDLVKRNRLLAVGDAFVLTDSLKTATTPSVVWVDTNGTVLVGRAANQKGEFPGEPRPARLFRELMGTTERVIAGYQEMTPEEASSHLLRHLKKLAEEVLGVEVKRAVITVPAWFTTKARQATIEAGRLAGLKVIETLPDPVAALVSTRTTPPKDSMAFLVYDLDEARFDATVVAWDPTEGFVVVGYSGTPSAGDDFIANTLDRADEALTSARESTAVLDLDEILMVGKSSELPMAAERVEERFGRAPRLTDPELCVAAGAASRGITKGPVVRMPLAPRVENSRRRWRRGRPRASPESGADMANAIYGEADTPLRALPALGDEALLRRDVSHLASSEDGTAPELVNFAEALEHGDLERARLALGEVSSATHGFEDLLRALGVAFFHRGIEYGNSECLAEARADLEEALHLVRDEEFQRHVMEQLERVAEAQAVAAFVEALGDGDLERAHMELREVSSNVPGVERAAEALGAGFFSRGIEEGNAGRFDEAVADLEQALDLVSDSGTQQHINSQLDIARRARDRVGSRPPAQAPSRAKRDGSAHRRRASAPRLDLVNFSVTAPGSVTPSSSFVVDVWAHLARERNVVIQRAREVGQQILKTKAGSTKLARDTLLSVGLTVEGLVVDEPVDELLWDGEVGSADFRVTVPHDIAPGPKPGTATVHVGGLQVAILRFDVEVGIRTSEIEEVLTREERHERAFASYAHDDGPDMFARLEGMQKRAPDLEVFVDVDALRSGENWQRRISTEISGCDVLYLFWSSHARESKWVNWEWRHALGTRGPDFIDVFPLVSPDVVPPPAELKDLKHFDSKWRLWIEESRRSSATHQSHPSD